MKVEYVDSMGTDLSVVNAARVSFGKKKDTFEERDVGLIQFLARGCTSGDWEEAVGNASRMGYNVVNTKVDDLKKVEWEFLEEFLKYVKRMPEHWTPFGHTAITLHFKAPIFVARQLGKHQVGMVWNEVSRRYVDDEPEFYIPEVWRSRADNVKQGSSSEKATHVTWDIGDGEDGGEIQTVVEDHNQWCLNLYEAMLNCQVAPEQARMVLPQSMYTEWYWTGNLYGFANIYNLRTDPHTQKETQEVAHQMGELIKPLFPVSWEALTG